MWGSLTYKQGCPAVEPCLAASWFLTPPSPRPISPWLRLTPEAPGGGVEGALEVLASWGFGDWVGPGQGLYPLSEWLLPDPTSHWSQHYLRGISQMPPHQSLTPAASGLGALVLQSAALTRTFWPWCGPLQPQNCV